MKQPTCVRLPADLLKRLKIRAIEDGVFVNELVERAVRDLLSGEIPSAQTVSITPGAEVTISSPPPEAESPVGLGGLWAQLSDANG